jgi:hypothetical protein
MEINGGKIVVRYRGNQGSEVVTNGCLFAQSMSEFADGADQQVILNCS